MSSGILDKKIDIFDIKKTPEIYPMTSMQETVEYFNDKLNQLSSSAYEASERLERLGKQVQQLNTRVHQPQSHKPSVTWLQRLF
jgi:prefoldin subunit 5